jgi:hypothetical protein
MNGMLVSGFIVIPFETRVSHCAPHCPEVLHRVTCLSGLSRRGITSQWEEFSYAILVSYLVGKWGMKG